MRLRPLLIAVCAGTLATAVLLALPEHRGVMRAAARARHPSAARRTPSAQPPPAWAYVRINPRLLGPRVPRSFLGLSTEYWGLPVFEADMPVFERVLALLRVPGDGPLLLRVGGDSSDHSFWDPRLLKLPTWVFPLTPAWLRHTRTLVRQERIRVILDLNLVTNSPPIAARWAAAAESGLPRGSIAGFEVGNEPDLYDRWYWRVLTQARMPGLLPRRITAGSYVTDFRAYSQALKRVAPHVPLLGPEVANPRAHGAWFSSLIAGEFRRLAVLTAHRYPYSACARRGTRAYPTVAGLLSERASAGIAHPLAPAVALARRAQLPFRLTELNSVTCGGRPGVSDSFATALWAPDALFELMRAGVSGVNVHVRAHAVNGAFAIDKAGLVARPLLYGLLMFARALGPRAHLLTPTVHTAAALHLKVWAVALGRDRLRVLLIDKGRRAAAIRLRVPSAGPATVERLRATSLRPGAIVTLAGQRLGPNASWLGARVIERVPPGPRGYTVTVRGFSAALVALKLRG